MKKIYIRTDASIKIGTGHVMRCLTLAEQLKEKGANVYFICRALVGNLSSYIEEQGFTVFTLKDTKQEFNSEYNSYDEEFLTTSWEEDAYQTMEILNTDQEIDWLIVDHYFLDIRWELKIKTYTKKIMVIDDLANREHYCDLLLDQNYYDSIEKRYDDLVPSYCKKLLGPQYALLRKEFREAKEKVKLRNGQVKRILVFFGGSDPTNETEKALEAIKMLNKTSIKIDVVVGKSNSNKEKIKKICSKMNASFYCQINNMAELMAEVDLAIGAGGSSTWERLYLGLPSIIIIVADNQYKATIDLEEAGAIINLGCSKDVTVDKIRQVMETLIDVPDRLNIVREKGFKLMKLNDNKNPVIVQYIMEK